MKTPRLYALALAIALLAAACTSGTDSTPIVTGTSATGEIVVGDTAAPETPSLPPTCPQTTPIMQPAGPTPIIEFFNEDPGLASVHMSQAMFECATNVVIVSDSDLDRVAVAAVLAASLKAPLLIGSANAAGLLGFEAERLAPEQIIAVGEDMSFSAPEWTEIVTLAGDTSAIADQINSLTGLLSSLPLPADQGVATLVTTLNAIGSGATVTPSPPPTTTTTTTTTTAGGDTTPTTTVVAEIPTTEEVPGLTAGAGTTGVAILVDGNQTASALAAFASAEASGAIASLIDEADLRRVPDAGRALQSLPGGAGAIHVFGDVASEDRWQLDVIRSAEELPGGGFLILPRILVALYGNPTTTALGALGEQGPADAATRVQGMAAQFEAPGVRPLPTFEIITTVAAGNPGGDGDYSNEMGNEVIQPWIDVGAQEGVYVILDLQPGRSDFLTQAKRYEQELLNPHVGLALDPEWRLTADQLPLQQIGRVQAAEVNQVVEWLANLVHENDLPQKILLLHQFREFMLEDRETIMTPPELQVIIQMDGQGAVPDKYNTWAILTSGWENHPWAWGWKNFYDEDIPGGGISPADVLQLVPTAAYVSYQ
jgi:hypothetical protein